MALSIQEQIDTKTALITKNAKDAADFLNAYKDWLNAANAVVIRSGNKRKDDEADRAFKLSKANSYKASHDALLAQNRTLTADIETLRSQQIQEVQNSATLAQQGLTPAAVQTRAEAEAKASQTVAQAQAKAIETKSTTEASTTADEAKTKMMIIWIAVLVFMIILGIIAYKKLKK